MNIKIKAMLCLMVVSASAMASEHKRGPGTRAAAKNDEKQPAVLRYISEVNSKDKREITFDLIALIDRVRALQRTAPNSTADLKKYCFSCRWETRYLKSHIAGANLDEDYYDCIDLETKRNQLLAAENDNDSANMQQRSQALLAKVLEVAQKLSTVLLCAPTNNVSAFLLGKLYQLQNSVPAANSEKLKYYQECRTTVGALLYQTKEPLVKTHPDYTHLEDLNDKANHARVAYEDDKTEAHLTEASAAYAAVLKYAVKVAEQFQGADYAVRYPYGPPGTPRLAASAAAGRQVRFSQNVIEVSASVLDGMDLKHSVPSVTRGDTDAPKAQDPRTKKFTFNKILSNLRDDLGERVPVAQNIMPDAKGPYVPDHRGQYIPSLSINVDPSNDGAKASSDASNGFESPKKDRRQNVRPAAASQPHEPKEREVKVRSAAAASVALSPTSKRIILNKFNEFGKEIAALKKQRDVQLDDFTTLFVDTVKLTDEILSYSRKINMWNNDIAVQYVRLCTLYTEKYKQAYDNQNERLVRDLEDENNTYRQSVIHMLISIENYVRAKLEGLMNT